MSNVVRTDIDALNAVLTITIPKETYLAKVKKDIQKYSQKSTMKGFRPGKTPPQLVRKIYGRDFLMDAVNETIQKDLSDYLQTEKPNLLGQPILSEEQEKFNLDMNNPKDVTFKFDMGLAPEFELQGVDEALYSRYAISVDESAIDTEIESIKKRNGKEEEVEGQIQEGDLITMDIKELGGTIEQELMVNYDWLTDDMKSVFATQSKGSQLEINIFQLEKETEASYVRKYFLKLEDNDEREVNENFTATIKTVKRRLNAELDAELLEKNFGPDITTVEQAKDEIRKSIMSNFDSSADSLLFRDIQDRLIQENAISLPDTFLKRWLKQNNEKNSDAILEKEYPFFADNLRWTLIRSKIAKSSDIQIEENDVREHYAAKIRGYFGGMPVQEDLVQQLVDKVYDDEKQWEELTEEVYTEKVFAAIKTRVTLLEKPVTSEQFREIIAEANAKFKNQGNAVNGEVENAGELVEATEVTETAE